MKKQAKAKRPELRGIDEQMRDLILERGLTAYSLGQAAGVDRVQIQRFLNRERQLRSDTMARLGIALGLVLADAPRTARQPARARNVIPLRRPADTQQEGGDDGSIREGGEADVLHLRGAALEGFPQVTSFGVELTP